MPILSKSPSIPKPHEKLLNPPLSKAMFRTMLAVRPISLSCCLSPAAENKHISTLLTLYCFAGLRLLSSMMRNATQKRKRSLHVKLTRASHLHLTQHFSRLYREESSFQLARVRLDPCGSGRHVPVPIRPSAPPEASAATPEARDKKIRPQSCIPTCLIQPSATPPRSQSRYLFAPPSHFHQPRAPDPMAPAELEPADEQRGARIPCGGHRKKLDVLVWEIFTRTAFPLLLSSLLSTHTRLIEAMSPRAHGFSPR